MYFVLAFRPVTTWYEGVAAYEIPQGLERVRKVFRQVQGYPGHGSFDGERLMKILHRQALTWISRSWRRYFTMLVS